MQKQSKAQRRRAKQAAAEAERQAAIAAEVANIGETQRQAEEKALHARLLPHGLRVVDIPVRISCCSNLPRSVRGCCRTASVLWTSQCVFCLSFVPKSVGGARSVLLTYQCAFCGVDIPVRVLPFLPLFATKGFDQKQATVGP